LLSATAGSAASATDVGKAVAGGAFAMPLGPSMLDGLFKLHRGDLKAAVSIFGFLKPKTGK
jgi:hypothetical protein